MIVDADNLTVRRRLLISENLAGRSILNAARDTSIRSPTAASPFSRWAR